jgi:hypothetical protein
MITRRPSMPGDRWLIEADLRDAEVMELAALGATCSECMSIGMQHSEAQTLFCDGEIMGMIGVMQDGGRNILWGVFTQAIDRHPVPFLRFCREYVQSLNCEVWNVVDARNEKAVRWFRWLGFDVSAPEFEGVNGEPFHRVTNRRAA